MVRVERCPEMRKHKRKANSTAKNKAVRSQVEPTPICKPPSNNLPAQPEYSAADPMTQDSTASSPKRLFNVLVGTAFRIVVKETIADYLSDEIREILQQEDSE